MVCPKCNTNNLDNSTFCIGCGNQLSNINTNDFNVNTPLATEQPTINSQPEVIQPSSKQPKNTSKLIIPILLICLSVGILYFIFNGKSSALKLDSYFDPNRPVRIKKDGLYGYIDINGKTLLKPQFQTTAEDFNGSYAVVLGRDKDDKSVYNLIDTTGKIKYTTSDLFNIDYVKSENVWVLDNKLYDVNLKQISKDGYHIEYLKDKYFEWKSDSSAGLMDSKGNILYTYKFNNGEKYLSINVLIGEYTHQNYCILNVDNSKYAVINCDTGKMIYDFNKFKIEDDFGVFVLSNIVTNKEVMKMAILNDKVVYSTIDDKEDIYFSKDGYFEIRKSDGKKAYYDFSTNQLTETRPKKDFKSDEELMSRLTKTDCRDHVGLSKDNNVLLDCEWDKIRIDFLGENVIKYFKNKNKEYVLARKDKKVYLIDINTKEEIVSFDTEDVYDIDNDDSLFLMAYTSDSDKVIYSFTTNSQKTFDGSKSIVIYTNYFTVSEDNKLNYYNVNLEKFYSEDL